MKEYIGHPLQLCGVQEYRLTGGKADGMRMLRVRNGKGLDLEISLDRAADISSLSVNCVNMGYFSPCGYVHPAYYQKPGAGFLKSFTAGFITTCGLTAVGNPCVDEGEELPLHGTLSHIPCERYAIEETETEIIVKADVLDAAIFAHKLLLKRTYIISKEKNEVSLTDTIVNLGASTSPLMLLYHCNMGYPLLSEASKVVIPSKGVTPRTESAAKDIDNCLNMEKPQEGYAELCYYHDVLEKDGYAKCGIYNPEVNKDMVMSYSKDTLDYFTEWKMMGSGEYVLGLEPGNCNPDGRDVMRESGKLKFLQPDESLTTQLIFSFLDSEDEFDKAL